MTTTTNPNLSIFKTLISLNAGRGCSEVQTNSTATYLNGDELSQLESRVRIYEQRKIMFGKTDAAILVLENLEKLIKDPTEKDKYTRSQIVTLVGKKLDVEQKVKNFSDQFLKEYRILVDEDDSAKAGGLSGIDLRDAQGLAPRADGSPFKTSDADLKLALTKYKTDQGVYKDIEDLKTFMDAFEIELEKFQRISPLQAEDILTKYNFNPWNLAKLGRPSLNELKLAVIARENLINEYKDAFNDYRPTDQAEIDKKIEDFVNPNKQNGDAVGANWPVGKSGMDYIHGYTDSELQLQIGELQNSATALNAQIGGLNAAKASYRTEFGTDTKVEAQIAGLTSKQAVLDAAKERRKLIAELTSYSALNSDFTNQNDADLRLTLDEKKSIFKAYYKEYKMSPSIVFQQTASIVDVAKKTGTRRDLNNRARRVMNTALVDTLQATVQDDNAKYEAELDIREKMVKAFTELGGENQEPGWKNLDNAQLQSEVDARKLIIDQLEAVYKNQRTVLDAQKKLKNTDIKLVINKREQLLRDIATRNLNPSGDSADKSDQMLNDMIRANDDDYNSTLDDITKFSGSQKQGDAPSNTPKLSDLKDELKKLTDARRMLLMEANTLASTQDANLSINGTKLSVVVAGLQSMSNKEVEDKVKEIKKVTKSTNQSNALESRLTDMSSNISLMGQMVKGIDMSDIQAAETQAVNIRKTYDEKGKDLDDVEADINSDTSLATAARDKLIIEVKKVKEQLNKGIIELDKKEQDIKAAVSAQANTQQNAKRIKDYIADIDAQNLQASNLIDKFNVTYETKTEYAIEMLDSHLQKELSRLNGLTSIESQEATAFGTKLEELRKGGGDWSPGEEVSVMIQSFSNFDDPDGGVITGQSTNSQRTTFAPLIKRGGKDINLVVNQQDQNAPFKNLDLGWEEKDKEDSVFISSWARIVPNRDNSDSITMLNSLGLEWLTEPLYVDMLDRRQVFNYNGFLSHYINLLKVGNHVDLTKRAEYTNDDGKPIMCSILLPTNKTLGGIFGVPVDLVTVGVAGSGDIEFLAAPSIGGLITEIRKTLIEAGTAIKTRFFPNRDERKDINDILKTFYIVEGNGVKATPDSDVIDITNDNTFGDEQTWTKVLKEEKDGTRPERFLKPGSDALASYEAGFTDKACAEAAFGFLQEELLDIAKIKLRVHRIQPYDSMTKGAGTKNGKPYLCLQCANLNKYCVLIKDTRSVDFDFTDIRNKLYIFNVDGVALRKHNDGMKVAAATAGTTPVASQLLDTDDEDVSNFRFIPNI
jgi:hypothetical protein